jgi:hypothetical protein
MKKQIHEQWLKAREETKLLRDLLDDVNTINRKKISKLYKKSLEDEQNFYFQLTGKRDTKERKPNN